MSNVEQSSSAASVLSPPPAKRMKQVYEVGPIESRNKWYLDEETADVHFVISSTDSDTARIPAHKTLLARDSDVFKAMFYGAIKEKGDIRLTDVTEAAFKEFLQFFYLTEVELSIENLTEVMHLGHKYNAGNCVEVCVRFFKDVRNAENILIGLDAGILYEHSELVGFCERFIVLNTDAVFKSSGFLKCDRKLLGRILNENLFICSEVELFWACMAWVRAKNGLGKLTKAIVDEHLGELFYNIRFGSMTIEEICNLSNQYGAVLSKDYKAITKLIGLPNVQQNRFNTQPRQYGTMIICDREDNNGFEEIWPTGTDDITFSANLPLILTGFTLFGNGYGTIHVKINKEIPDTSSKYRSFPFLKSVLETSPKIQNSKIVHLPHSLLIRPGQLYTISIAFPYMGLYTNKEVKKTVHLDCGAIIEFHDCKASTNGTKMVGMISTLNFNRI